MTDDPTVTVRHMRAVNLCARGSRTWFAAAGLSWSDFVSNGIPASRLEATGDPYAISAAQAARREARDE